jgi:DNA-binding XRE family transcriptional regulator
MFKIMLNVKEFSRARIKKGLSIIAIANELGISRQSIYQIHKHYTGANPITAKKISDFFGVEVDKLFNIVESKPKNAKNNTKKNT